MKIGLVVYQGCMASGLFAFAELLEVSNKRSGKKHFDYMWRVADHSPINLSVGSTSSAVLVTPQVTLLDDQLDAILLPGFCLESPKENELVHASHKNLIEVLAKLKQD